MDQDPNLQVGMNLEAVNNEQPAGGLPEEAWRENLNRFYDKFLQYGREALGFEDVEDVHQARVNSRKLMTMLKVLDKEETTGLLPILKKAQKVLGKVRDEDVLIEAFQERRDTMKEQGEAERAKQLKAFIRLHKDKRSKYRKKLAKAWPSIDDEELQVRWEAFVNDRLPGLLAGTDINSDMKRLEEQFDERRNLYEQMRSGYGPMAEKTLESLHKVRIAGKEIRYLSAAAGFALSETYRAHAEAFKDIQKELGEINDRRIWLENWEQADRKELGSSREVYKRETEEWHKEVDQRLQALHIPTAADIAGSAEASATDYASADAGSPTARSSDSRSADTPASDEGTVH